MTDAGIKSKAFEFKASGYKVLLTSPHDLSPQRVELVQGLRCAV